MAIQRSTNLFQEKSLTFSGARRKGGIPPCHFLAGRDISGLIQILNILLWDYTTIADHLGRGSVERKTQKSVKLFSEIGRYIPAVV